MFKDSIFIQYKIIRNTPYTKITKTIFITSKQHGYRTIILCQPKRVKDHIFVIKYHGGLEKRIRNYWPNIKYKSVSRYNTYDVNKRFSSK